MAWRAPVILPPSAADCAVARLCLRHANPTLERAVGVITWLADEKAVLAAAAVVWMASRSGRHDVERREAERMLGSVILAGLVPHIFKYLVRRERPNRSLIKGSRKGVPRLGNAWDSFPSGHAVHLGAIAGSLARMLPRPWRPTVWLASGALAASRVVLLAHYPTDVLAGWGLGVLLNKATGRLLGRFGTNSG
jgi:membrane-associated phospholipid phosphatase